MGSKKDKKAKKHDKEKMHDKGKKHTRMKATASTRANNKCARNAKSGSLGSLARMHPDVLTVPRERGCSVGQLERRLLSAFPATDAEPWDRTGLVVGDPNQGVTGVSVALDVTVETIDLACACGANVLVTHHPVFLESPTRFTPASSGSFGSEAAVYEAIRRGVALMNFHTALDVSYRAQQVLPGMLHLEFLSVVSPLPASPSLGYGQLCKPRQSESLDLKSLSARCVAVFGRMPRVWGAMDTPIRSVVTATGSAGNLIGICAENGYDCLIVGEVKYHDALAAAEAGLCIIELGHDVSELPLCAVLAATLESNGISEHDIKVIDQSGNWTTPESIRK